MSENPRDENLYATCIDFCRCQLYCETKYGDNPCGMVKELSAWKSRAEKAEAILTEYQRRERVVVEELETIRELVRNVGGEAEMFSWDHATTALATLRKPVGER